ncbi:MAG: methyltransferase domain-containing protein [Chitinophagaceae bacterium]
MHFQSHFNTAINLINQYKGEISLSDFLKQYFSRNKKHGSKDRKFIAHFCYCYYRLGHALKNLSIEERLKTAIFLCNNNAEDWNVLFSENWLVNWQNNLPDRIKFIQSLYPDFSVTDIFPWEDELTESLDITVFSITHLIQPNLFLRIRPGKGIQVIKKLHENKIQFQQINKNCLSLNNATKIANILEINKEVVVQDYSSQEIQNFFPSIINHQPLTIWDCCAGSGGKSILAFDILKKVELTVSDVRLSIIQNLHKRFKEAGLKNYKNFVTDLTNTKFKTQNSTFLNSSFDLIICDAPCTGSGTWSRTPEQLYFFTDKKINYYADLQKKIVSNVISYLKKNGFFLYITCSVFRNENEEIAAFIQKQFHFELVKQQLFKGYETKADTMFAALFQKLN